MAATLLRHGSRAPGPRTYGRPPSSGLLEATGCASPHLSRDSQDAAAELDVPAAFEFRSTDQPTLSDRASWSGSCQFWKLHASHGVLACLPDGKK
jgi:hypothetical protein